MSIKIKKSKLISLVTEAVKRNLTENPAKVAADVRVAADKAERVDQRAEYMQHWPTELKRMVTLPAGVSTNDARSVLVKAFGKAGAQVHSLIKQHIKAQPKKKVNPNKPGNRSDASLSERSGDKYRQEQRVDGAKKDLKYIIDNHPEHKESAEDLMSKMNGNHPPLSAVRNLIQRAAGKDAHLPPQYRD
jgi:hypothetical protein